ncbi:putative oxidoreductase [Zancudomyces culisetae]|uniref:Putative oxidoreductase n=1 Tax=Zancudomyces culisetae TaxID=1213189 RepID=A0A1R1PWX6_ZANCU|nr:putative oxidoreductase [Zancudomyces culisetae]|eukprot:OMH85427.1 putative oxidoreductase [Zancudomyces culisetae]
MFERIRNKTVVITGASSGFGNSIARIFVKYGANVVITARRLDRLEELKAELLDKHPEAKIHPLKLDVTDKAAVVEAFSKLPEWASEPDVLINNAGVALGFDPVSDLVEENITKMFDTNVKGVVFVTQQVLPSMKKRNEGVIINIGSLLGIHSVGNLSIYSATKHALRAITDSLRIETNSTKIRVVEVDPGMAETEFNLVRTGHDEELSKNMYNGVDLMTPEDVAEVTLFAASRHPRCVISQVSIAPQAQANPFILRRNA